MHFLETNIQKTLLAEIHPLHPKIITRHQIPLVENFNAKTKVGLDYERWRNRNARNQTQLSRRNLASTNLTNLSNYDHDLELKNKEAAKIRLIIAEQLRNNKKKISALDVDAKPYGSTTSLEPLMDSQFQSRNSVFTKQNTVDSKASAKLHSQKPLGQLNINGRRGTLNDDYGSTDRLVASKDKVQNNYARARTRL